MRGSFCGLAGLATETSEATEMGEQIFELERYWEWRTFVEVEVTGNLFHMLGLVTAKETSSQGTDLMIERILGIESMENEREVGTVEYPSFDDSQEEVDQH